MNTRVPPIKCQGIKTKLLPLIIKSIDWNNNGVWVEPFTGSGVVGFNLLPSRAIFADSNPHLINFYTDIQNSVISSKIVKAFLFDAGNDLLTKGEEYYYDIRSRFNSLPNSLDFLFLNRSCFNGVMRFNRKGEFNVPFCRKPNRFAQAYITKITNQVAALEKAMAGKDWMFVCQDFRKTILMAGENDFIYSDPPYIGRHVDYFDSWPEENETDLFNLLSKTKARFMLSTWEENSFRRNNFMDTMWNNFFKTNHNHFYHVGGKEKNRNPIKEALITNYPVCGQRNMAKSNQKQLDLVL